MACGSGLRPMRSKSVFNGLLLPSVRNGWSLHEDIKNGHSSFQTIKEKKYITVSCPSYNSQNFSSDSHIPSPSQPVCLFSGMQLQSQHFCIPTCVSSELSVSHKHMAQICGQVLQQKQTAIQQDPNVHLTGTCHTDTKHIQTGPRV